MRFVLAYIDAGTGSMIMQVAIAAILAIPFFLRNQIGRAARFLRGQPSPKESRQAVDDAGRH
jgi:hypothetical protein